MEENFISGFGHFDLDLTAIAAEIKALNPALLATLGNSLTLPAVLSLPETGSLLIEHQREGRALALEVMAQRAHLSSAERLLVELAAFFGLRPDTEMTEADA